MEREAYRNKSVYTKTLRIEDIAAAFLAVLEDLNPNARGAFEVPNSWVKDEGPKAFRALWDLLSDNGPVGCHFGARLGEGGGYGFWSYN